MPEEQQKSFKFMYKSYIVPAYKTKSSELLLQN